MPKREPAEKNLHQRIYDVVRQIPRGKVASYGQIALITGGCTPRMIGYALASLTGRDADVPWQRVVNSQGRISRHGGGLGSDIQRSILEKEGVVFTTSGKIDLKRFGWHGPGNES